MRNESIIDVEVFHGVDPLALEASVVIDMAALSYRSFLRSFGHNFIYQIYHDILQRGLGFLIVAKIEGKIVGFVIACYDSGRVMGLIPKRFGTYFKLILVKMIQNPTVIFRLVQTLWYTKKEQVPVQSELLAIATDEDHRAEGIGGQLVRRLNEEFRKKGIRQYKVTVHAEMEQSNRFYINQGMSLANTFTMYGVVWNLYIGNVNV